MDSSFSRTSKCAVKTDLNLLLECLKYQMNCPDSQKQALLTIYSICQQKEDAIDYFQSIGGVLFVYNLSQSSNQSEVKEAALFTLGALVEKNVFCQQALCRPDIFTDLTCSLVQDFPLSLKRTFVYMVSVLVVNNRAGQTLAKVTGCIDVLLKLFRKSFPSSSGSAEAVDTSQLHQLWASVSSALCGCVNNPQNEENQQLCTSIFPVVKVWLQEFIQPRKEMVQPVCSFIAMTVASNSFAQGRFASAGGLAALAQCVAQLAPQFNRSPQAREAAVTVARALCACVTDNALLATALAEYQLVPQLLALLSCPALHPRDQLCITLTLGHCTEASKDHQLQFLQSGGLSHMINLLTESQDEELKKAATFVLQTCKQMTKTVGAGRGASTSQGDLCDPQQQVAASCDIESFWSSANEILQRIKQLERVNTELKDLRGGVDEGERDLINSTDKWHCKPLLSTTGVTGVEPLPAPGDSVAAFWESGLHSNVHRQQSESRVKDQERQEDQADYRVFTPVRHRPAPGWGTENQLDETRGAKMMLCCKTREREGSQMGSQRRQIIRKLADPGGIPVPEQVSNIRGRDATDSRPPEGCIQTEGYMLEDRKTDTGEPSDQRGASSSVCRSSRVPYGSPCTDTTETVGTKRKCDSHFKSPVSQDCFRQPALIKGKKQNQPCEKDHLTLCSDIINDEISTILKTSTTPNHRLFFRCSGCTVNLSLANSRTLPLILSSCQHKCDRHMVLLEAERRYKKAVLELIKRKDTLSVQSGWISLTPIKKSHCTKDGKVHLGGKTFVKEHQDEEHTGKRLINVLKTNAFQRRERKNFTHEEVKYIMEGVKKLGPSWNAILWSYPFQTGRTSVDLAKKYSHLQKASKLAVDSSFV